MMPMLRKWVFVRTVMKNKCVLDMANSGSKIRSTFLSKEID